MKWKNQALTLVGMWSFNFCMFLGAEVQIGWMAITVRAGTSWGEASHAGKRSWDPMLRGAQSNSLSVLAKNHSAVCATWPWARWEHQAVTCRCPSAWPTAPLRSWHQAGLASLAWSSSEKGMSLSFSSCVFWNCWLAKQLLRGNAE